jgi:hypothetical protein
MLPLQHQELSLGQAPASNGALIIAPMSTPSEVLLKPLPLYVCTLISVSFILHSSNLFLHTVNSLIQLQRPPPFSNTSMLQFEIPRFKTAHFRNLEFTSTSHSLVTHISHSPEPTETAGSTKLDLCILPGFHFLSSHYGTTRHFNTDIFITHKSFIIWLVPKICNDWKFQNWVEFSDQYATHRGRYRSECSLSLLPQGNTLGGAGIVSCQTGLAPVSRQ